MQAGNRGKGRPKGSPNKRSNLSVAAFLTEKGIKPVEELIKLLPFLEPEKQANVYLKLQEYIEPKAMVPLVLEPSENELPVKAVSNDNLFSIIKNSEKPNNP